MKKVTFLMALAVAAGMASCTAQSPKADLKTDIDSLSYAIGMARTEGLDQYLAQQGIDSTQMSEFLKGFNEGAAKIDKKDVAYMAGLQPTNLRQRLHTEHQPRKSAGRFRSRCHRQGWCYGYDESSRVHAYSDGCHQRKSNCRKVC